MLICCYNFLKSLISDMFSFPGGVTLFCTVDETSRCGLNDQRNKPLLPSVCWALADWPSSIPAASWLVRPPVPKKYAFQATDKQTHGQHHCIKPSLVVGA